jgi:biotin/methionine sulfoxide reductase
MRQAIEPIGQARSDFAIFTDLARRLGCEGAYAEGRDEMAWLRHLYESWRSKFALTKAAIPLSGRRASRKSASRRRVRVS